jgi:hypothetical protein
MLYNPKWNAPGTDIFSLDSLIAWLEKQPAEREYDYVDGRVCMMNQYLSAHGIRVAGVAADYYRAEPLSYVRVPLPHSFIDIALRGPATFGAALARAKAFRDK